MSSSKYTTKRTRTEQRRWEAEHKWSEPNWDDPDWEIPEEFKLENLPSNEEIAAYHQFSPEFEAKMEALFQQERELVAAEREQELAEEQAKKKREERWRKARKFLVPAACLLLALGITSVGLIRSEAVPFIQIEVFQEFFENFTKKTWGVNVKETGGLVVVEPPYMTEGYELVSKNVTGNYYYLVYQKNGEDRIVVRGNLILASLTYETDTEGGTSIFIGDKECVLSHWENDLVVSWEANGTRYKVSASVPQFEIEKIVKGMISEEEQ